MKEKYSNKVFYISVIISILIVVWGLLLPNNFSIVANSVFQIISIKFGWIYILSMAIFIVFSIWIAYFSRFGNIRLSKDHEKPEYSIFSWFAMFFFSWNGCWINILGSSRTT